MYNKPDDLEVAVKHLLTQMRKNSFQQRDENGDWILYIKLDEVLAIDMDVVEDMLYR